MALPNYVLVIVGSSIKSLNPIYSYHVSPPFDS